MHPFYRFIAPYLLMAVFAAAIGYPAVQAGEPGDHPWNNKRIHYLIEYQGRMVEKGEFVRRVTSYQRIPCIVIEEEKHLYDGGDEPIRSVKTRTMTTPEGLAMLRHETVTKGEPGEETITVARGEAVFDATGVYGTPGVVPVPPDAMFEINGEWLAGNRPRRGDTYFANILDRSTRGVVATSVTILDRGPQPISTDPTTPAVWLAEINTPGRPGILARYTSDGRLVRMEGGGLVYHVVTREQYDAGKLPSVAGAGLDDPTLDDYAGGGWKPIDSPDSGVTGGLVSGGGEPTPVIRSMAGNAFIGISEAIPAWDSFSWLLFQASPAYEWSNALPSSEYARVNSNGAETTLMALQNAPYVDPNAIFPVNVPNELLPYLENREYIPASHPAVIDAAWVAVADVETKREETNILKALSYLAGWINQSIALVPWRGYDSSALDTLANRSGDSLGQARLFAAMARTLGVPTRVCQGFITHIGRAVNHCWAEAWVNGQWVPVDTTVSRVGLPAGYVLAERSGDAGVFNRNFADFLRTPGLGLALREAGRDLPRGGEAVLRVGDRRTYVVSEGDWLANLYWGFALRLPRGWRGDARMNSVEIQSDDGQALARIEALEGDFEAGRAELDATVEGLRRELTRFRLYEANVVDFDDEGATPALYVDFSCIRDGETVRCRQYVIPRRQRAFRLSFWAPVNRFEEYRRDFDRMLSSFEF